MKIKSLIIDDDAFMQKLLKDKLNQFFPEITVVDIANSGADGLQKIQIHDPDLIFLDVEMPDMTGFEMLSKLDTIAFQTIFITSYSHYAIKAIRFNALDYLIKPIDLGELKQAIKRYKAKVKRNIQSDNVKQALLNFDSKNVLDRKLTLQTQNGKLQLALKDIIRVEAERNYSYIVMENDKKHLISKTLGDFEELLEGNGFFRCHKSHIINGAHIKSHPNSYTIMTTDEQEIPIARRKREAFKLWYDGE
ncbi:MAG: LytTR family DNA-binding domain-containing protein [Saprospiraceae bacterium]